MLYLIQQIWIWIVVAALIGFLFGWLLRWRVTLERVDKMEDDLMLIRAARDRLEQDNKRLNVRIAALETENAAPRDKPQKPAATAGNGSGGAKPPGLTAPQPGGPDDLKRITGIDRDGEERLHQLGIYHYDQIAAWTHANAEWIETTLQAKGRVAREGWVEQAARLARGQKTDFSRIQEEGAAQSASSGGGR